MTAGIVSARGRDIGAGPYDDFIQIDAPVNKGNSGGPTFDVDGNVIGVNTAIFSPSGGSVGIAFAIPRRDGEDRWSPSSRTRARSRADGSACRSSRSPPRSPTASASRAPRARWSPSRRPNGPAAKAGIKSGDVITAVNGSPVKDARDLATQIGAHGARRHGEADACCARARRRPSRSTLGELPNEREARATTPDSPRRRTATDVPRLGLTLAPAGQVAGSGKEGVVVTDVDPNGLAAEHGFKTGDVILEVAGKKVANPDRRARARSRTRRRAASTRC